MTTIGLALVAATALPGCATRLPWTAENVPMVAKKCGLDGLTAESRGIMGGGLARLGGEPAVFKRYRCLKRHIQVPENFMVVSG